MAEMLDLADLRISGKDMARDQYVRDHAPYLLAALIVRRNSTDPQHLIETAISAASSLFDRLPPENEDDPVS